MEDLKLFLLCYQLVFYSTYLNHIHKIKHIKNIMSKYKINKNNQLILIAGGGTGGHLFPAIAIGEEIKERIPNAQIHFVGSNFGLEAKVYPVKDLLHTLLPIRGLQRNLSIDSFLKNLLLPFRLINSLFKLRILFKDFSPQLVIGTGGYASAIPLLMATRLKPSIPIVLQEQNSYPGLTTRWFAKKANLICTAFHIHNTILDERVVITGNPIRNNIINISNRPFYNIAFFIN